MSRPLHCAVLGSTRGSNLTPLHTALSDAGHAFIKLVISNQSDAGILERASQLGLPHLCLPSQGLKHHDHEVPLQQALLAAEIDLIVLIGYMRILSPEFIQNWPGKIINVHPSLLPKHAGLMDLAVHQAVLDNQEQESGCSVHIVNDVVDGGQVLIQRRCPVLPNDAPCDLKARVQALEAPALFSAIHQFVKENAL